MCIKSMMCVPADRMVSTSVTSTELRADRSGCLTLNALVVSLISSNVLMLNGDITTAPTTRTSQYRVLRTFRRQTPVRTACLFYSVGFTGTNKSQSVSVTVLFCYYVIIVIISQQQYILLATVPVLVVISCSLLFLPRDAIQCKARSCDCMLSVRLPVCLSVCLSVCL